MTKYGEESFSFVYDVFLSFRGEDTRNIFVKHLHKELCRKGIKTFIDEHDLGIGEGISPALSNAIERSKILMVVFSKNYASSQWCLNELVKILDSTKRNNNKQHFFPVFYHVDPSDIRYQTNSYQDAMIAHEDRFGKGSKRVQAWRSALLEAANMPGEHIQTSDESKFIEKIAEKVRKKVAPKPLHTGRDPIGLEPRIEEVKSLLDMKPGDKTVRMLGIYGLGGIGKTELAKVLYDSIVPQFEAASFLAHVREKSKGINGLEDLQKTLLSEMLEEVQTELGSTSKGASEIKYKLCQKRVLLVLDDVDDKEQLQNLVGGRDWFGSGSRIIITTRDKDLLIAYQVEKFYKMTELDEQHSLELFCWNAFKQNHPKTGYEDVALRAVHYAKGLPLALEVLGSDLATIHEESLDAWESALEDYQKTSPNKRIKDVLKISYDRLGDDAKNVFLDIACFFKGKRIEYAREILKDFGSTLNINVLVNKSLLTVENGFLEMHDLIQDMGKEIVKQESPNPGERSRLWYYLDVINVLATDSGSDKIQGIILDPPKHEAVDWNGSTFEKMKWLRILVVQNTSFSSKPQHLPNYLRLLDWEEYPSNSLPLKFHPKNIIVFNLCRSHMMQKEVEKLFKKLSCLTCMNLSNSQSITKMPDVSKVPNLRELRLDNCRNLIEVHESVGFLKKLAHFSASHCPMLRNFLPRMFLPSLEVLDLNFCVGLECFPDIMEKMEKPLKIYMMHTSIRELPYSIGNLIGLVYIEIQSSKKLMSLPSTLFMLPNVIAFKIGGCSQLRESFRKLCPSIPNGYSKLRRLNFRNAGLSDEDLSAILICFPMLEELIVSRNTFVCLPVSIKESKHLTSLNVSVCVKLTKIPECPNLRILDIHHCEQLKEISVLSSTVQKVDARHCGSLTKETLAMLWCQVSKEINGLEIVMPLHQTKKIPEDTGLNFRGNGGNPQFWARGRGKFPVVALALVFHEEAQQSSQVPRQLAELHLVVNGKRVRSKGYYSFRIAGDHVLMCDLRLLFSSNEWQRLDEFLQRDWNHVMVLFDAPSSMSLGCWGVFVYEYKGEDVLFECPDSKYGVTKISSIKRDRKQELIKMIDKFGLDEVFERLTEIMELVEPNDFFDVDVRRLTDEEKLHMMGRLYEISRQAKNALEFSRPSEKQGQECSALARDSDLVRFLETLNTTDSTSGHRKLALLTGLKNKNDQTLKVPTDADAREASKRERCESKAKKINNKLQRKLKERKALRKKLEEIEKEIALLLPKKRQSMNNSTTDQDALNATTVSVSKGRDEEFAGLYDAGIEGFKNRKEFEDEVRAIYSKGVKNGILEARATLLALEMRFKEEQSTRPALKKNEEHVKVAADNEISVQQ